LPAVGREDAAKVKHVSVEEARVKVQGVVQYWLLATNRREISREAKLGDSFAAY
jgi:hypothetical protein